MTSIEAPVTLEAHPVPKMAKRKVKAAAKTEKVHKKIVKSNSKGRKFPFSKTCYQKTHTEALCKISRLYLKSASVKKRQTVCFGSIFVVFGV
jgi:hypothetical protein